MNSNLHENKEYDSQFIQVVAPAHDDPEKA